MRRNRKDLRLRSVRALAGARAVVAARAGAVVGVEAVEDVAGLVPVADAALPAAVADRVVARVAKAPHAGAVADVEKAKAETVKVGVEMVEASSSRT
jgi:hypothetical protein